MLTASPQQRSRWSEFAIVGAVTFMLGASLALLLGAFGF